MALIRYPDLHCPNCKRPMTVTFHDDKSIRSSYCHDCPNRPPGPENPPKLIDKGKFGIEQTKEGFRVFSIPLH